MPKGSWDGRGQGSWDYSREQYDRLVDNLRRHHTGIENAILTRDLAAAFPDIEGRALRGIQAEADGKDVVLCTGDWGVFVAEYVEDAERSAGRLFSQAAKMNQRARAKIKLAMATLPRRQGAMFEAEEEPEDDAGEAF